MAREVIMFQNLDQMHHNTNNITLNYVFFLSMFVVFIKVCSTSRYIFLF